MVKRKSLCKLALLLMLATPIGVVSGSLVLESTCITAEAATTEGWKKSDGNWYYYKDGKKVTGWQQLPKSSTDSTKAWFYFNGNGVMQTGWKSLKFDTDDKNYWYYFSEQDATLGQMLKGWQQINSNYYYFDVNGHLLTGWQEINNNWYYFDETAGAKLGIMSTGMKECPVKSGGKEWYYFGDNGVMVTEKLVKVGDYYYYFNEAGRRLTGWVKKNDVWYYLDPTTARGANGILELDGEVYGFTNAKMVTNTLKATSDKTKLYYLGEDGKAIKNQFFTTDAGDSYLFGKDGAALSGWQTVELNRKYFNTKNFKMTKGWAKIDDANYYFDEEGNMITGISDAGTDGAYSYYFNQVKGDDYGKQKTGYVTLSDGVRFFDPDFKDTFNHTGSLALNADDLSFTLYYKGQRVDSLTRLTKEQAEDIENIVIKSFDSDSGIVKSGLVEIGSAGSIFDIKEGTYYFDDFGTMKFGWQTIDNKSYYFNPMIISKLKTEDTYWLNNTSGMMIKDSEATIDGNTYYFKEDGTMQSGWYEKDSKWYYYAPAKATNWTKLGKKWYYFDTKTGVMKTGWLQSGKTWYYLDTTSGAMKTNSWVSSANKWYYFDANGKMVTGWKQIGGKWYFFNSNGSMKANAWFKSGSAWYYFGSNGIMKTNAWQKTGSAWYYLQADGTMAVNKTLTISGKKYTFDKNGVLK